MLYEAKGLEVAFGGVDDFFAELARERPHDAPVKISSSEPLENYPSLAATTSDVRYEATANPDVSRMFNGWPATYADIQSGLTFERQVVKKLSRSLSADDKLIGSILGASGVGKSTAARQLMLSFKNAGISAWEHSADHTLDHKSWIDAAKGLAARQKSGVLFIDDAHLHLFELNELVDGLVREKCDSLKVVVACNRNNWEPRAKSPNLFKYGAQEALSKLSTPEIDDLISLVDREPSIGQLVESSFAGFSLYEKRRRLAQRCEADLFVCMKNIFASESFDNIMLREYAELGEKYQDIYKVVAALETMGVRVHRQLIMRLLGIEADEIGTILRGLADIVTEYTIERKEHIYGWRGRHQVINGIIKRYKYNDPEKWVELFDRVIDHIYPTYDIEVRSLRELCNIESGLATIPDKETQNRLLRKMISTAPGERVPRHRLIRNLISMRRFDQAQTEIRIFQNDFGDDSPVARYSIQLLTARAVETPGILKEDRLTILEQAREAAVTAMERFSFAPRVFAAYCEVGLATYGISGDEALFQDAMSRMREAEDRIGDPLITKMIRQFDHRYAYKALGSALDNLDASDLFLEE